MKNRRRIETLSRWFFFGVLCSILPLIAKFLVQLSVKPEHESVLLQSLLERGELLIVSAAIAAEAIGTLVGSGSEFKLLKIIAGGCCLCSLFCASLWFAGIPADVSINRGVVAVGSLVIFGMTLLTSGCTKYISEN